MKTAEELNSLKNEVDTLKKKLAELTDDELAQVIGGVTVAFDVPNGKGTNQNPSPFESKDPSNNFEIPLIDGKTFWELENELEWV